MINFNQILPNLYVGTCPTGLEDIEKLKNQCGITAVLNLQSDEDLRGMGLDWPLLEEHYRKLRIEAERAPMKDFDYNDQRRGLPQAVKILARLLASGHRTYLHCNAGAGRSPLVAMAYLYWCRGLPLRNAIRHVEERRPCSPYDELLEVSRDDLLCTDLVQKAISRRASKLSIQRGGHGGDTQRYWPEAEREILKKALGR